MVKRFEGREVLSLERLDLPEGIITVVEGPNGAGKTTLLSILALITPRTGAACVSTATSYPTRARSLLPGGGKSPWWPNRPICSIPAWPRTWPMACASGAWSEPSATSGWPRPWSRWDWPDSGPVPPGGFPGEMQRVALARALVLRPRALLLDEPFANLDPDSSQVFERVLGALPTQGCTVVLVSHALEQAHRLAQEVVYLRGGRLAPPPPQAPGA